MTGLQVHDGFSSQDKNKSQQDELDADTDNIDTIQQNYVPPGIRGRMPSSYFGTSDLGITGTISSV